MPEKVYNRYKNFKSEDYFEMLRFLEKKKLSIYPREIPGKCSFITHLVDKSKSKLKVTCIPLSKLILEYQSCGLKKYDERINRFEKNLLTEEEEVNLKKELFKELKEMGKIKNKIRDLKYFMKINLPKIKKSDIKIVEDHDGDFKKTVYSSEVLNTEFWLSQHEICNGLSCVMKMTGTEFKFFIDFSSSLSMPSDFNNIYESFIFPFNQKNVEDGFIPIIYCGHWLMLYYNKKFKYLVLYDSDAEDNLRSKSKIYFWNFYKGLFISQTEGEYNFRVRIMENLKGYIDRDYKFLINCTPTQKIGGTCGYFAMIFAYLVYLSDKTFSDIQKVLYAMSLITDDMAKKIIEVFYHFDESPSF